MPFYCIDRFYHNFNFRGIPDKTPTPYIINNVICGINGRNYTGITVRSESSSYPYYLDLRFTVSSSMISAISLESSGRWFRYGYPLFYSEGEVTLGNLGESATIHGKYRVKDLVNTNRRLNNVGIPINFVINGERYISFCIGKYSVAYFLEKPDIPNTLQGYKNIEGQSVIYGLKYGKVMNKKSDGTSYPQGLTLAAEDDNYTHINVGDVIDFGSTPQEVPEAFLEFIEDNYDKLYDYTYTIQTTDGTVLTTSENLPAMKHAKLNAVGNFYTLTLTGINDKEYNLEWECATPEGENFIGLNTTKSKYVILKVGDDIDINFDKSTTLYMIFGVIPKPLTTFDLKLFNNISENIATSKTLINETLIKGVLRDECSILNPSFVVESVTVPKFNYAYVGIWDRYYFINEITSIKYGMWRLDMSVDVLQTYDELIAVQKGFVERNEFEHNPDIIDDTYVFEQDYNVEVQTKLPKLFSNPYKIESPNPSAIYYEPYNILITGCGVSWVQGQYEKASDTNRDFFYGEQPNQLLDGSVPQIYQRPFENMFDEIPTKSPNQPNFIKVVVDRNGFIDLINDLVTMNWTDNIGLIFTSVSNSVNSVIWYPFQLPTTDFFNDGSSEISLVKIKLNGIEASTLKGAIFDGNKHNVFILESFIYTRTHNDFRDFGNYSTLQLKLPFYGEIDLDINRINSLCNNDGKCVIDVFLYIDFLTGMGEYIIGVRTWISSMDSDINSGLYNNDYIITKIEVQLGVNLPLSNSSFNESLRNALFGVVTSGATAISHTLMPSRSTGTITTENISSSKGRNEKTGRMIKLSENRQSSVSKSTRTYEISQAPMLVESASQSLKNIFTKYDTRWSLSAILGTADKNIVLTKKTPKTATITLTEHRSLYGAPLGTTKQLSTLKGYTVVSKLHIENATTATTEEISEIESLLAKGVIFPDRSIN